MHEDEEMIPNERAWLRFLRDIGDGRDPGPTLRRVQSCGASVRPGGHEREAGRPWRALPAIYSAPES